MKRRIPVRSAVKWVIIAFLVLSFVAPVYAKDVKVAVPKEHGVYIKTKDSIKRLLPNVVYEYEGVFAVEPNNPPKFLLKNIEYFVFVGDFQMEVLTYNALLFFGASPVGKTRYMFGKDIPIEGKEEAGKFYVVKPKELFGRGYFALWINDTAWDFLIE